MADKNIPGNLDNGDIPGGNMDPLSNQIDGKQRSKKAKKFKKNKEKNKLKNQNKRSWRGQHETPDSKPHR